MLYSSCAIRSRRLKAGTASPRPSSPDPEYPNVHIHTLAMAASSLALVEETVNHVRLAHRKRPGYAPVLGDDLSVVVMPGRQVGILYIPVSASPPYMIDATHCVRLRELRDVRGGREVFWVAANAFVAKSV